MHDVDEQTNAYIDRQRALARERQQRSRERKRTGHNGHVTIIDRDTGKPSLTLTNIATNIMDGMNNSQSLIQAGSSRKAVTLIDKAKQGLSEALREKGLTITKVIDSTKDSLDATSEVWDPAGNRSIERPEWNARAQGRRDAIALLDRAGELPSAQATQGGTQITVNIVRFDTPQHVVTDGQFTSSERVINTQAIANTGEND